MGEGWQRTFSSLEKMIMPMTLPSPVLEWIEGARVRAWRKRRDLQEGVAISASPLEYVRFSHRLRRAGRETEPLTLKLRNGRSILVRPARTHYGAPIDYGTAVDTFARKFHRPPRRLGSAPTIVDLGANVGYTVVDFALTCPGATIIGVELDDRNFHLAERNVSGLDVQLLHAAIAERSGSVMYDRTLDFDGLHIDAEVRTEVATEVIAITVPKLMDMFALESIDYLKMDIEGAEIPILFGSDVSWLDRVGQVGIEIHNDYPVTDVLELLRSHGMQAESSRTHWATALGWRPGFEPD